MNPISQMLVDLIAGDPSLPADPAQDSLRQRAMQRLGRQSARTRQLAAEQGVSAPEDENITNAVLETIGALTPEDSFMSEMLSQMAVEGQRWADEYGLAGDLVNDPLSLLGYVSGFTGVGRRIADRLGRTGVGMAINNSRLGRWLNQGAIHIPLDKELRDVVRGMAAGGAGRGAARGAAQAAAGAGTKAAVDAAEELMKPTVGNALRVLGSKAWGGAKYLARNPVIRFLALPAAYWMGSRSGSQDVERLEDDLAAQQQRIQGLEEALSQGPTGGPQAPYQAGTGVGSAPGLAEALRAYSEGARARADAQRGMLEAIMQTRREPDTLDRLFSALAAAGVFGQGGDLQGFLQSQRARREGLTPQQEFLASRLLMQESQDPSELQQLTTLAMLDPTLRLEEGKINLTQAQLQQLLSMALMNQATAQMVQEELERNRAARNANQ